jgi:hypothetical protein
VGVAGFSWGGLADVVLAMRDVRVDAVVSLDGSIRSAGARDLVLPRLGLDARNLRVPFALLAAGPGDPEDDPSAFVSRAIYSERLQATFPGIVHRNFCSHFNAIARLTPGTAEAKDWRGVAAAYDATCAMVLAFVDTHVKGSVGAPMPELPKSLCTLQTSPAVPAPPTEGQFLHVVLNEGAARARAIYERAKKADPQVVLFHEAALNALGYYLLQNGRAKDAADAFGLNTTEFPDSANAWDSLGEACLAAGDLDEAERCYRESLRLAPGDARLSAQTRQAIVTGGQKALETIAARRKAR